MPAQVEARFQQNPQHEAVDRDEQAKQEELALAYELDNRYHNFRELLKGFSEREESLKEKLLNRDHLLSSLYN